MKKLLIRVGIGVGVVIAIIALVVCFVPLKEVAYTVTVDYQDIETYYENEPYEDVETYYEDEPYEDTETYYENEPYEDTEIYYETEPLDYEVLKFYTDTDSYKERRQIVIGGVVFQDEVVEVFFPIGCVTLQNIDNTYGTFRIQFTFYALDKLAGAFSGTKEELIQRVEDALKPFSIGIFANKYCREESLILKPDETGTITCSVQDIDINEVVWEWEYEVIPATKTVEKQRSVTNYRQVERQRTVTKYKQVEKERTVTKYKQGEKERTVTKQRPETRYKKVSLLEYLLYY